MSSEEYIDTREKHIIVIHQFRPAYAFQAYCRFAGIPYTVLNSRFPKYGAFGELPYIQHGSMYTGPDRSFHYLKRIGDRSLDDNLSEYERSVSMGLVALVNSTLRNVALWSHLHSPTYGRLTRLVTPFPVSQVLPQTIEKETREHLSRHNFIDEQWVRHEAVCAYRALSAVLSNSSAQFFFGSSPTTLDALVYGHLCEVKSTIAGNWLAEAAPALLSFYTLINSRYFVVDGLPLIAEQVDESLSPCPLYFPAFERCFETEVSKIVRGHESLQNILKDSSSNVHNIPSENTQPEDSGKGQLPSSLHASHSVLDWSTEEQALFISSHSGFGFCGAAEENAYKKLTEKTFFTNLDSDNALKRIAVTLSISAIGVFALYALRQRSF